MDTRTIIDMLGLQPHPEGGWYRETWREGGQPRAAGTAIYFLLEAGQESHWHRVDSTEIWHWYAGTPMTVLVHEDKTVMYRLGPDIASGARPQVIIPAGVWQSTKAGDGWGLAGCTVSPGFEFEHFELAPEGWSP
ncbi:MAG: cupin domain-containing protein [Rhodobacteraceae bacterium]|nr:cupin domain-containing protein [Paracoccaceae bacterium]